jgi:MbtH protein
MAAAGGSAGVDAGVECRADASADGKRNKHKLTRRKTMAVQDENDDIRIYRVVINHEEQYSIWPVDKQNPLGWTDAGESGTKQDCLNFIKEAWTDMRPLSLRKKMEAIN